MFSFDKTSQKDSRAGLLEQTDLWVLLLCGIFLAGFASLRQDFIGDGLRHLPHILSSQKPAAGEARWFLFPGFLFTIIRPFAALGWIEDLEGAIKAFLTINVVSALFYLSFLRLWLKSSGIALPQRAVALGIAGFSAPLLMLGSNLAEPVMPAALALAALSLAARQRNLSEKNTGLLLLSVFMIVLASLFYQSMILALFFLPLAAGFQTFLKKRILVPATFISLLIPGILLTHLIGNEGYSFSHAAKTLFQAYQNPLGAAYLKNTSLFSHVVAFLAGPPQGIVPLKNFSGMHALFFLFGNPSTVIAGILSLMQLLFCLLVLLFFLASAVRSKNGNLLLAFASILILPVFLRHQQYAYLKFYILLPVFLAFAISRVPLGWGIGITAIIALLNITSVVQNIRQGRLHYAEVLPIYEKAGTQSCWISSGHIAPVSHRWRGKTCGLLQMLAEGSGENPEALIQKQNARLEDCYKDCFCHSSEVLTDSMTSSRGEEIVSIARYFKFSPMDLSVLLWNPQKGSEISHLEGLPLFSYSKPAQEEICAQIQ